MATQDIDTATGAADADLEIPTADAVAAAAQPEAAAAKPTGEGGEPKAARPRVRDLPRLATRVFGVPLMVAPSKLDAIMAVLGPRLGAMGLDAMGLGAEASRTHPDGAAAPPPLVGAWFDDDEEESGEDLPPYALDADGIATIAIDGTLVYKSSWLGALSGLVSYGEIGAAVHAAIADPAVRGILLAVDSNGGECSGCFDLADAIHAARQHKPVFAVAADDAYSAAYALASAAEKLFVSRTSGVGSIGVVALHVDRSKEDAMDGRSYTYVHAGARKVDGNPHAPLSDPARAAIQAEVDRLQGIFAASVAKYRGLSVDEVLATEAATFHGENAVAAGLADSVGTPADARAALKAEIERRRPGAPAQGGPAAPVVPQASATTAGVGEQGGEQGRELVVPDKTAAAPAGNVVDLATMRDQAKGEGFAAATEIAELCNLAGRPELAAGFIRDRASVADVRRKLQDARAEASAASGTTARILPDAGGQRDEQAIAAGWDYAIAKAEGRPVKSN